MLSKKALNPKKLTPVVQNIRYRPDSAIHHP